MVFFETVDRAALIVRPRKKFIDWLESLGPIEGVDSPKSPSVSESHSVYLLPTPEDLEFFGEDGDSLVDFVERHAQKFFEAELGQWTADPDRWPPTRDWTTFRAWMHVQIGDTVIDTVDAPVLPLDADLFGDEWFEFYSDLRDVDGTIIEFTAREWIEDLMTEYRRSPERDEFDMKYPLGPAGLGRVFFQYLMGEERLTQTEARSEHVEQFLFDFIPREVVTEPAEVTTILENLRSFFRFLGREYNWPQSAEMMRVVDASGVELRLRTELVDTSNFSQRKRAQVEMTSNSSPSVPYVRTSKVGRNDPCPCGSGKKFKKCCG